MLIPLSKWKYQGVAMKKRQWVELNSGYKNLPKRIPEERLKEIVTLFRRIDIPIGQKKDIEHELIMGHLRLGVGIAINTPDLYSNLDVDDIIGEMELAVTKAVRQAKRGALEDNNITSFIVSYIKF